MKPATAIVATEMIALGLSAFLASLACAQTPYFTGDPQAGRDFALEVCTPCHVVSSEQLAPRRFATAPDFRDIANTRGTTATSLAAFLHTSHPSMPNLVLSADEARDVIAYILSLQERH